MPPPPQGVVPSRTTAQYTTLFPRSSLYLEVERGPWERDCPVQRNVSRCPGRGRRSNYIANASGYNPTEDVYKDIFVYYLTLNGLKCRGAIKELQET